MDHQGLGHRISYEETGEYRREEDPQENVPIQEKYEDSHLRSLLKGFTYRLISSATTIGISLLVVGDMSAALQIGFVEFFAKILIYYIHERIWAKIRI
jgi:uncharacterized membrane protein